MHLSCFIKNTGMYNARSHLQNQIKQKKNLFFIFFLRILKKSYVIEKQTTDRQINLI